MIQNEKIKLLENIAQIDYENLHYDFHNDFNCFRIDFNDQHVLILSFKHIECGYSVLLNFFEVEIEKMIFFNGKLNEELTLDNLYRGRVVLNNELREFSNEGKAYFYMEFYEGQQIEFWSKGLSIESYL